MEINVDDYVSYDADKKMYVAINENSADILASLYCVDYDNNVEHLNDWVFPKFIGKVAYVDKSNIYVYDDILKKSGNAYFDSIEEVTELCKEKSENSDVVWKIPTIEQLTNVFFSCLAHPNNTIPLNLNTLYYCTDGYISIDNNKRVYTSSLNSLNSVFAGKALPIVIIPSNTKWIVINNESK